MSDFNPILFLLDFFETIGNFATVLYDFLFKEQVIGSFKFIPIVAIGGGTIITIIILKIVKEITPLL